MRRVLGCLILLAMILVPPARAGCRPWKGDVLIDGANRNTDVSLKSGNTFTWSTYGCQDPNNTKFQFQVGTGSTDATFCTTTQITSAAKTGSCITTSAESDNAAVTTHYSGRLQMGVLPWTVPEMWQSLEFVKRIHPGSPKNVTATDPNGGTPGSFAVSAAYPAVLPDKLPITDPSYNPLDGADAGERETFYLSFNTDPNASGTPTCSEARDPNFTPRKTWGSGIGCAGPGDTIVMLDGDYDPNTAGPLANYRQATQLNPPSAAGNASNPITIRAQTEGYIQVGSTTSTYGFNVGSGRNWHIYDGLRVQSKGTPSNTYGAIRITQSHDIVFRNISADPNHNANSFIFLLDPNASNITIESSDIVVDAYNIVEINGPNSRGVTIRGNDFSSLTPAVARHSIIQCHNNPCPGLLIEGNRIHDATMTTGGAIALYLGSEGAIVRDNFIYNIADSGTGVAGINSYRSGGHVIENNTFYNVDRAIVCQERCPYNVVKNNYFDSCRNAIYYSSNDHDSDRGWKILNNYFYNTDPLGNWTDIVIVPGYNYSDEIYYSGGTASKVEFGLSVTSIIGNDFAAPDCGLADPNAGDFTITAGSPCKDAGLKAPVPVGGGSSRDVGAYEVGTAGPPYTAWAPKATVASTSPNIRWTFYSPSFEFRNNQARWKLHPGDSQNGYRIQLDQSPYFNSVGGIAPTYATALVASGSNLFVVPATLSSGTWYARIRTADTDATTFEGPWSSNNFAFSVP